MSLDSIYCKHSIHHNSQKGCFGYRLFEKLQYNMKINACNNVAAVYNFN